MSSNLQHYVYTIINQSAGLGFLGVEVKPVFGSSEIMLSGSVINASFTIAYLFFASDVSLYFGIVAVIAVLGFFYSKTETTKLAVYLIKVSAASLYLSFLLNLAGLYSGLDFLASYNILLFAGSYSFTMFSQVLKIVMVLIVAALYTLFPYVTGSNMRILELPLLLQITVALCATILSSANLALLLLSLEGFSLILYIMTALGRTYGGITASVKYFAFGTLGSIFLF